MNDCIFCRIASGEIPSAKVYEDDSVLGFKDITPQAPVHILVIPKQHMASVLEIPHGSGDLLAAMMSAVQQIAREQGLADDGFRLVTNTGSAAGQVVHHLHFHILGGRQLGHLG